MADDLMGILQGILSSPQNYGGERGILRRMENQTFEDQRKKSLAEALLGIPYYAADRGRVVPFGNNTGQPAVQQGQDMMYPSSARSQMKLNPLYDPARYSSRGDSNVTPQYIPADLAAILELIKQGSYK